jgi:hypothetical protein
MEKFLNIADNISMRRMFIIVGFITALNAITLITPTAGALLNEKLDARSYALSVVFRTIFFLMMVQLGLC